MQAPRTTRDCTQVQARLKRSLYTVQGGDHNNNNNNNNNNNKVSGALGTYAFYRVCFLLFLGSRIGDEG